MSEQLERELGELKMLHRITEHRLTQIEKEQLPQRVANIEPMVKRIELNLDDLNKQVTLGLREVRDAVNAQKSMHRGVVLAVAVIVGFVQLLPLLKGILT